MFERGDIVWYDPMLRHSNIDRGFIGKKFKYIGPSSRSLCYIELLEDVAKYYIKGTQIKYYVSGLSKVRTIECKDHLPTWF